MMGLAFLFPVVGGKMYLSGAVALESDEASVATIPPPLLAQKGAQGLGSGGGM